jgi:hypothetical protein
MRKKCYPSRGKIAAVRPFTSANSVATAQTGTKPAYADELKREEMKKAEAQDRLRAELQKQADQLFEAHQWEQAKPVWKRLAEELPHDWTVQLKAAMCHTFGGE